MAQDKTGAISIFSLIGHANHVTDKIVDCVIASYVVTTGYADCWSIGFASINICNLDTYSPASSKGSWGMRSVWCLSLTLFAIMMYFYVLMFNSGFCVCERSLELAITVHLAEHHKCLYTISSILNLMTETLYLLKRSGYSRVDKDQNLIRWLYTE